jgi:two-component sensor histidine kinase
MNLSKTDMKSFTLAGVLLLLTSLAHAQQVILDGTQNRFLINQKSKKPRIDVIVQQFTHYEKVVIAQSAVMDTLTKPQFERVSDAEYNVTASRMGEKLTFVIRDFDQLQAGYVLHREPVFHKGDSLALRRDVPLYYILNGERTLSATGMSFGLSHVKLTLRDKLGKTLFRLNVNYSYPKPQLTYVDIIEQTDRVVLEDTANIRRIVQRVNQVPTVYSQNNSVPDRIVTSYNNLYFGFKKAYYDGQLFPSSVICKIDERPWTKTTLQMNPFADVNTLVAEDKYTDFYIFRSGKHILTATYVLDSQNVETYEFEMHTRGFRVVLHYLSYAASIMLATLFVKPWILFLLVGLILFSNWGSRMKRQREAAQRINLELQSIQSQLNPHFVFNALGSVQGLVNKNEVDKANDYLTDFSKLLRNTLNNNNRETVPLSVEMHTLESYIKLEQLRFNFLFQLNAEADVPVSSTEIPPLLIQPLVENAIKHGISGLGENGFLHITFTKSAADLIIDIADNGKGFDVNQAFTGKGIQLTKERIKLLNKQKHNIILTIASEIQEGTRVRLVLKKLF